jgi:hypothetical protein
MPRRPVGTHIGIEMRLSIGGVGPIFQADSDMMHFTAQFRGTEPCDPSCLPNCQKHSRHGWIKLLNNQPGAITVEIRPVELPDEYPDD